MKLFKFLIIILLFTTAFVQLYLTSAKAEASSVDSASLMEKINEQRVNRNIPALVYNQNLAQAAEVKTSDMINRGYFDHIDPDGHYVWQAIEAAGYKPYKILGENLAIDFSSEDAIIQAWINSPSHRDNMFRAQFADQGLSAKYGNYQDRYTSVVTSLFGALVASPTPAPSQVQPVKPAAPSKQPKTTTSAPKPKPTPLPNPLPESKPVTSPVQEEKIIDNKREPAAQLSLSNQTQLINQQNKESALTSLLSESGDFKVFETVRTVFIGLAAILFFTIFGDILISGKLKGLWGHPAAAEKSGLIK